MLANDAMWLMSVITPFKKMDNYCQMYSKKALLDIQRSIF